MPSPKSAPFFSAFSLIEVTLALGISTFAILSMLALMPVGLTTLKDAADSAGRAQVLTHVASVLRATPFTDLPAFLNAHSTSKPLLFDRAGRPVDSANAAAFGASLSRPSMAYPGAPSNLTNSALAVTVVIANLKPGTLETLSSEKSVLIIPKS